MDPGISRFLWGRNQSVEVPRSLEVGGKLYCLVVKYRGGVYFFRRVFWGRASAFTDTVEEALGPTRQANRRWAADGITDCRSALLIWFAVGLQLCFVNTSDNCTPDHFPIIALLADGPSPPPEVYLL